MLKGAESSLLLRGNVVLPDGVARDRYILVRDGRIAEIGRRRPPLSDDVPFIETAREDWILPGLLDLHTHSAYNFLPLWRSPNAPFANRFEWRGDAGYRADVSGVYKGIRKGDTKKVIGVFGELQAVAGGTVVLQESYDLDRETVGDNLLLCRDTASARDLELPAGKRILSVVNFFRPDRKTGLPQPVEKKLSQYANLRKQSKLVATLVHLAEGRSGFGSNRGVDPYTRQEFETLMAHPAMADAGAVRSTPLSLIHGCGIDPGDKAHIRFLRERNISVIWSPVSNLLLYGDTIDVESLLDAGINVALGSDWSPSGSKHVWDEAKFARFYFDAIGSPVPDELIFQMVTTNAGRCLGVPHLGRIAVGALADFFIIRSPVQSDNPLEVFLATTDRDVRATIIGGRPIYGDKVLLSQYSTDLQRLPRVEGSAVKNKAVHLPQGIGVDVDSDIHAFETAMKALDPPVKRSNLLASSDKPYRQSLQMLRARVERFGWNVREWRHKGPGKTPGRVPVSPDSVRVWRGFRHKSLAQERFVKQIGGVFIPAAVQLQGALGLTAYLPGIVPQDKPEAVPDEAALVFFKSQAVYKHMFKTVAGRTFGLMHQPVFDMTRSRSGWPVRMGKSLTAGKPCYLLDAEAGWHGGLARAVVVSRDEGQTTEAFLKVIHAAVRPLAKHPPDGLDAVILAPEESYVIYWEHWQDPRFAGETPAVDLTAHGTIVMMADANPTKVEPSLYKPTEGPELAEGDLLSLRFVRRALLPW